MLNELSSQPSFKLNRLNIPFFSRAQDGVVVRCWIGKLGNHVSASSNPGWELSFLVENK